MTNETITATLQDINGNEYTTKVRFTFEKLSRILSRDEMVIIDFDILAGIDNITPDEVYYMSTELGNVTWNCKLEIRKINA